ncbi:RsmB/NOP family class I SAM-dependent RNA methyltransferase [Palleronia sediminis]|uniref:RsmB/NOP family class I SAM-dependent RNA methyltransferase n=1 Tax=Palleronia sediminis TaxID=2547833 RepID=A0A4V3BAQ4_9RHOB|nr:RsmB/NOP family class I SAM-dependent RNA methyltransferase [Palleronia sediminis]TDL83689.1 RsmB/NOP family class I SAM-dependent RNA methyltransferase [Palleronia sediminis]
MTPGARAQAAILCLDAIEGGTPAEKVLTNWARGARYAGSRDRAAVRDLVFDILRRWWSVAIRGGGTTGRARMIGYLREIGGLEGVFDVDPYGPGPLTDVEQAGGRRPEGREALDWPEWLWPELDRSLGPEAEPVARAMRDRAPVFLRANPLKTNRDAAIEQLAAEGITARAHPLSPTAIEVIDRTRAIPGSHAFHQGLIEIQDAASQAVIDRLPPVTGLRVLDFCAGGGGKTLALAAHRPARLHAHDKFRDRMKDLLTRATRAGAGVKVVNTPDPCGYDLVLADAPCSGSGAWRRQPHGKISMNDSGLEALLKRQDEVLSASACYVAPGGYLAYATCSIFDAENGDRVAAFLESHPEFRLIDAHRFTPLDGGDGFYIAILQLSP